MKRVYGIHFAGVWVDQATRVVSDMGGDDGVYCPAREVNGCIIPAEYVVCSGPSRVMSLFFKYFDWARKTADPTHQLVLLCEPTIIEYTTEQIMANADLREAVCESCFGQYYGWDSGNLASELSRAVNGVAKYEELF